MNPKYFIEPKNTNSNEQRFALPAVGSQPPTMGLKGSPPPSQDSPTQTKPPPSQRPPAPPPVQPPPAQTPPGTGTDLHGPNIPRCGSSEANNAPACRGS